MDHYTDHTLFYVYWSIWQTQIIKVLQLQRMRQLEVISSNLQKKKKKKKAQIKNSGK